MLESRVNRLSLAAAALLGCAMFAAPASAQVADIYAKWNTITVTGARAPAAPHMFGTVALPARVSRYAEGWERARRDASGLPQLQALIAPARGLDRERQIAHVQAAVHRQIRWISDATEWGEHDYWASAAETLRHGAGDMEDRAILKMQALKALGVPQRDLYLTMGRDAVGGQITVLIVRDGARMWMVDDTGGAPTTTDRRPEFQPMLTFGYGASWLHGRRVARPAALGASTSVAAR